MTSPTLPRSHAPSLALAAGFALAISPALAGPCDPAWTPGFGLSGGGVSALAVFDNALHASGSMTSVLRLDGDTWTPLPGGPLFEIRALAVFDDGSGGGPALYCAPEAGFAVGGEQTHGIARATPEGWVNVGAGVDRLVLALHVHDDGAGGGPALYAGGTFTTAGAVAARGVARWNGESWSAVGDVSGTNVEAFTTHDDGSGGGPALYAAGISLATTSGAASVARWDGATWTPLGPGVEGPVVALASFDDGEGPALYAAGTLRITGQSFPFVVGRWRDGAWTTVGPGFNGNIGALAAFDDGSGAGPRLYAGGAFSVAVTEAGDVPVSRIARWDGAAWSPLGPGANSMVTSFQPMNDGATPALFVGGQFSQIGGATDRGVSRWTGCALATLPADLNGDGAVDSADLALLLGSWGAPGGPADLDNDGVVGSADLAMLLGAWGG